MYLSFLQIPLGAACLLAICATGHPVQGTNIDIKARWPGFNTNKNPLDLKIEYIDPPSGKASDLVLQITLQSNVKDLHLLKDRNRVLFDTAPVDALTWKSGLYGTPQFKGDSKSAGTEIDLIENIFTLKKDMSYKFLYKAGDSYDFAKVAAGTYIASLKPPWFWVMLDGEKVDKVYVPEVECPIPIAIAPKKEDSADIQVMYVD